MIANAQPGEPLWTFEDMTGAPMGGPLTSLDSACRMQTRHAKAERPERTATGTAPDELPADQADPGTILEFLAEALGSLG